jgi:hypothetical protein
MSSGVRSALLSEQTELSLPATKAETPTDVADDGPYLEIFCWKSFCWNLYSMVLILTFELFDALPGGFFS